MGKTNPTDSTDELQDAIRKLEEFSRQPEKASLKPLQKTIDLVRGFIFSNNNENSVFSDHEVREAIEVINRKRFLIQKLKKIGSPAEQKLAEYFLDAIDGFNAKLDQKQKDASENQGIAKFFLRKEKAQNLSKIDLPLQKTVHHHYPEHSSSEWLSRKISSMPSASMLNIQLSKQSKELFQMKVIALLERYGIASNPEARTFVKSSPIITSVEEDHSRCILTQTIHLFPGQTIVIKGSSELNPQTRTISKLFPETFCLLLQSTQTGFPHPSQRTGWTLANQLVPDCPQRTDLLSHLSSFYQYKKQAVQELWPKGGWIGKAKKMIKLKRDAFIENKDAIINCHKQLAMAIVNAAPVQIVCEDAKGIIERYFCSLGQHQSSFDFLCETHQMIADAFITQPHAKLMEAAMDGNIAENKTHSSILSCTEAGRILSSEVSASLQKVAIQSMQAATPVERSRLDYIACMGAILGHSSKAIMLQYLSEDLIFDPPELNEFEKKLQSMAYRHVMDFLEELSSEWSENAQTLLESASHHIKEQIEADIKHWTTQEENPIADELALYFKRRYQHLST